MEHSYRLLQSEQRSSLSTASTLSVNYLCIFVENVILIHFIYPPQKSSAIGYYAGMVCHAVPCHGHDDV